MENLISEDVAIIILEKGYNEYIHALCCGSVVVSVLNLSGWKKSRRSDFSIIG
jgi:hypothetical protein